ncbi:mitochondrial proton/calcium exchanger protein-like protein isoform X1 [Tanacetum coccineum]
MSKVLHERGFGSLPSSIETNPRDHVKSFSTIVEVDASSIRRVGSHKYTISTKQNSTLMYETKHTTILFLSRLNDCYCEDKKGSYVSKAYSYGALHIDKSIPRLEKDPGCITLPCYINNVYFNNALADLGASVSAMPLSTYLNLGLGGLSHTKLIVELADRTAKYLKGIVENMLVGIGKFVFPVDFIILDMPEDVKVPLILGRPFLSTAHAKIDVFKRKITFKVGKEKMIFISVTPARETLVLNRSLDPFFGDYIELNDLNVPLELRRDQVEDLMPTIKEGEVIEEFRARNDARMVSKSFVYPSDCDHDKKIRIDCAHNLKLSCMIDFAVLEDMDAYRDEGMGDAIFGELFLREVEINARWFEGMITIHNGFSIRRIPAYGYGVLDLATKKSTKLVKYKSSGILCVIVVMLEYRRMEIHDLNFRDLAKRKEIDEVGEVSIIWNPMCDCSHAGIQTAVQHTSLLINSTWRIYRAKYQGSFSF